MKLYFFLILFFSFSLLEAQEETEKISISFENATLKEVFSKIEEKTDYNFYYLKSWLGNRRVSGNFREQTIQEILSNLLQETMLNFYILDSEKIILTQNNVIYDQLPAGFFPQPEEALAEEQPKKETETQRVNPLFYGNRPPAEVETVRIGRETRNSYGQTFTLSGRVVEKETGEPIPNLSILKKNSGIGTVTDENGEYQLELPAGLNILETKSLGSEDVQKRVIIFNDGQLNMSLRESYEMLGEILLESDPDSNVKDAVAGSEEINVEEIKNIPLVLGVRDIFKVAITLPGISSAGEGASGFNVRGGKADQNLILLDDAVIYNPTHFFGIFSALNPFTTGEVTIYKGHIPAKFGGRLSSVFDMKTKDANTEKFAGEASFGPVTSNLALEIPVVKGKSGILLGGRTTYSNWILKNLDEESLKESEASFYDIVAKYNHKFNLNNEIKATGYFSHDRFSITSDSLYSYSNRLFSLRYNHNFNENNKGSIIATNSNYQFNIDFEGEENTNFTSGYNIDETELKLNMDSKLNPKHTMNYGISGKLYQVDPGQIDPLGEASIIEARKISAEQGLEAAVYLADNFEISEKLLLNAGIRFSMYASLGEGIQNIYQEGQPKNESTLLESQKFGKNEVMQAYGGPELRFSARYLLQPDLSVKASYNNTFQYIHTLTSNTTMSPTDTYKLSGNNIKPQKASQYSLGLFKNFEDNMYELSVEGYYKKSENLLDFKVGAQLFLNENIETEVLQGEGKSYGAEFMLKKTSGRLNGWLAYSYSRSFIKLDSEFKEETVNNGEYFPSNFDKPHDFSAVTNYKLTRRYSFSANFVYQTGRPVTYPTGKYRYNNAEYVVYSDRNKFRIPDYYRLDLSFNVEGNHKIKKFAHSFWSISVYNVLGRNNPYSVFFVTDDGNLKAYKTSIFSVPVPTITYNFKF